MKIRKTKSILNEIIFGIAIGLLIPMLIIEEIFYLAEKFLPFAWYYLIILIIIILAIYFYTAIKLSNLLE